MSLTKPCENIIIETGENISNDVYSKIISDIVKYLAFLNYQLPFSYDRLKICLDKYDLDNTEASNAFANMFLRSASAKMVEMDTVFESLDEQYCSNNPPVELCIAIGSTPSTCKDVYHILTPHLPFTPAPLLYDSKSTKDNTLLKFTTNPALANIKHQIRKPSLTYTYVKKLISGDTHPDKQFIVASDMYIPSKATHTFIHLKPKEPTATVDIFEDSVESGRRSLMGNFSTLSLDTAEDKFEWYQCVGVLRGFRDKYVRGRSVLLNM